MASGTFSLGTNGNLTGQLVWSSTSNGTAANTSTVTIKIQAKKINNTTEATYGTWKGSVQIGNNSETYSTYASVVTSWVTLKTYTKTIEHQDSGYQDVYLFGSITGPSGTSLSGKTVGKGSSVVLDQIPRASALGTISNFTIGNAIDIPITKHSSSFTDTLTISLGGTTIKTISGITNSYDVSFTTSELNAIYSKLPNATTGSFTFTLTTKSGSTTLGTSTKTATGTIPSSVKPTISSVTVSEANTDVVPNSWGVYVKNKSKLKFVTSASGGTGSSISSVQVTVNGNTYTGTAITTNIINASGSLNATIKVTDSRGRYTETTKSITIVDYGAPYISSATAIRCDANGNYNDNGTYMKVSLDVGIYSVSEKNTASYKVQYKKATDSSYTTYTFSSTSTTLNNSVILPNIDTNSSYDVQVVVSDYFTNIIKVLPIISTSFTTVDYLNGGHGIAFGKVAEEEDLMDINFDVRFNKKVEGIELETFKMTSLFSNAPSQGEIGKLSEKGSSVTLDCNFEDYDMLFILFATRIWGWLHKWEIVPVRYLDSSSIQVGNLFGVSVPCYNTGEVAMMQYYITNNNTITVHYNSHTTGDNHLYIKEIVGVKFKN